MRIKDKRNSWKVKTRSYACAQFACKISKARMERAETKGWGGNPIYPTLLDQALQIHYMHWISWITAVEVGKNLAARV